MVEEPLLFKFFSTNSSAGESTTGVNGQFVFSQVLIDCLLRLKSTQRDKQELMSRCQELYDDDSVELDNLRDFQNDYSPNHVLWWYTRESFFYRTLNTALRKQNIHMMFLFREYISDIHHQLKKYQSKDRLQVYRGQMISSEELKVLQKSSGQFISVNSFFSTSTDAQYALSFLSASSDENTLAAVLFIIDAAPNKIITKSFANISAYSEYKDESEVLFMLGTIFHLNSVDFNNDLQVWCIQMTLCSDDEHDLKQVLIDIKQQLGSGETNLRILGKVLWEMGRFDLAEKYLIRLLDELPPNDPLLGDLYTDLGKVASQTGDLDKSMEWRQKAIAFKNQNPSGSSPNIHETNNSHGKLIERKTEWIFRPHQ